MTPSREPRPAPDDCDEPVRPGPRSQGRRGTAICGRFALAGGLATGLAAGWLLLPQLLYSEHPQPMNFDHAVHTEAGGMECAECHGFRADGSFTGIPPVGVCAGCHSEPLGESAAELFLVTEFVEPEREIPWLVYAQQPQNVYFSHVAHVRLAEIECAVCHGPRDTTQPLPPVEVNRISTYSRNIWGPRIAGGGPQPWDSMKMSDCSGCHARRGVQDHCLMCHK